MRAYRGLRHYRGEAKFSTWLCQIALNVYRTQHVRTSGRAEAQRREQEVQEPTAAAPAGKAPLSDRSAMLRRDLELAMRALNDEEREALAAAFGQDMTHEEAADVVGCPLGTLKSRVNRALDKLQPHMAVWRDAVR